MRFAALLTITLLAGCQDRYRYPCQDPAMWDKPVCKKPICSSSYTCPDQLASPEVRKVEEDVR